MDPSAIDKLENSIKKEIGEDKKIITFIPAYTATPFPTGWTVFSRIGVLGLPLLLIFTRNLLFFFLWLLLIGANAVWVFGKRKHYILAVTESNLFRIQTSSDSQQFIKTESYGYKDILSAEAKGKRGVWGGLEISPFQGDTFKLIFKNIQDRNERAKKIIEILKSKDKITESS